jgi:hypothetical protein
MDDSSSDEDPDRGEVDVGPGRGVTIVLEHCVRRYAVLKSVGDALDFVADLERAKREHIAIDGMKGHHRIVEKAIAAVYNNTVTPFPDDDVHKGQLLLILWSLQAALFRWNIESAIYCLHLALKVAPTGFDRARLMLLSQCDTACSDEFVPLPNADWDVIRTLIVILRREKNGKAREANRLLRKLGDSGRYELAMGMIRVADDYC